MKTTIELPDELLYRAKVASAKRRVTFKQLVVEGLEGVLADTKSEPVGIPPEYADSMVIGELGVPVFKRCPEADQLTAEEYQARIDQIRNELGEW